MQNKKYYWCPTCKDYPDRIIEIFNSLIVERKWNEDCYELEEQIDEELNEVQCSNCRTPCEEKEQE